MNFNIRVSWPAWLGINSLADIIVSIFSKMWYSLITDIEYESRIKWWVNYFDINISSDNSIFLTKEVDSILVFNLESLNKSLNSLKNNSTIFLNSKIVNSFTQENKDFLNSKNIEISL